MSRPFNQLAQVAMPLFLGVVCSTCVFSETTKELDRLEYLSKYIIVLNLVENKINDLCEGISLASTEKNISKLVRITKALELYSNKEIQLTPGSKEYLESQHSFVKEAEEIYPDIFKQKVSETPRPNPPSNISVTISE